jgi:probable phosphoglycerate mutase
VTGPNSNVSTAGAGVGDQPGQQKRSISDFAEMRNLMEELTEEGFVFASAVKGAAGGVTYNYLHPDKRDMLLIYKQGPTPAKDSSVASGTETGLNSADGNLMEMYASEDKRESGPDGKTDYILRHGCTKANDSDEYRGWGTYPLDEDGIAEAEAAAQFLKDKGLKKIVTSSLVRHQQTASIISKALGIPVETDENLRTLNVGDFTGKKRKDVADELNEYFDNPEKQIPGGESVDSFMKRSNSAVAKVRADQQRTLIVTSRSNIFALMGKEAHEKAKVSKPGGVYTLNAENKLAQVFGGSNSDTLAGS